MAAKGLLPFGKWKIHLIELTVAGCLAVRNGSFEGGAEEAPTLAKDALFPLVTVFHAFEGWEGGDGVGVSILACSMGGSWEGGWAAACPMKPEGDLAIPQPRG